ncbi:hypothetical protein [Streptomyces sp. B6B3]|uniref:hypothetical protein n=1 Tax=Streptomyces sp. B6B3 TaxID=3153570 RepID=UPI00325E1731
MSDARCAVCRAQLARLRAERGPWAFLSTPAALVALLLALVTFALVVARPA